MKIILPLLLLLFNYALIAQTPKHEVGIEGGPNFSYLYIKAKSFVAPTVLNKYANASFSIGASYQKHYNSKHSFRTGILLESLGNRNEKGYDSTVVFGAKYLSVPLLYQYSIISSKTQLYCNTGLSVIYYINKRSGYGARHIQLGYITSLGFKYNLISRLNIGVEVRNNLWFFTWSPTQTSTVFAPVTDPHNIYTSTYFRNHTALLLTLSLVLGS